MWVILRRLIPNALELTAANAHDRHPDFIMKLRISFHLQRAAQARWPAPLSRRFGCRKRTHGDASSVLPPRKRVGS